MIKITLAIIFISFSFNFVALAKPAKLAICSACHGTNGIGTTPDYPNINGQKKNYIIKQLKAFKNGVRKEANMNAMAGMLSDKDIKELANYYSKLK